MLRTWRIRHPQPRRREFDSFDDLAAGDGAPLEIERSGDDMFLMYTGGTTGLPKGVMWPSATWWPVLAGFRAPSFGTEAPTTIEALQAQIRSGDDIKALSDGLARFTSEVRNADPQLRTLLMVEGGVDPAKLMPVLGYDGSPITARFISDEISNRLRGLTRTPTPLVAE